MVFKNTRIKQQVNEQNTDSHRKKELDLSIFRQHAAAVDTSIGRIFLLPFQRLYPSEYTKQPDQSSIERIRSYLPYIASLSASDEERVKITAEQLDQLLDDDIEALAEAYASSSAFRKTREGSKDQAAVARESGEAATAYLDRLLRYEIEEQVKQTRKIMETALGVTRGIFDPVRQSSLELGDSWQQLERLTKTTAIPQSPTPAFETKSLEFRNHMAEHTARIAQERAEDREILRLTAETSVKSAKMLQELADAASTMLEKLDERDADAKRTTKTQLWIAVGSVAVSAILALLSYYQDRTNNESGDEWQAAVLSELKTSNERGAAIQTENQLLRNEVQQLTEAVSTLKNKANVRQLQEEEKDKKR